MPAAGPNDLNLLSELLRGISTTLVLVAGAFVIASTLGCALALMRVFGNRPLRWLGTAGVEYFRNTPLLVLMYIYSSGLAKVGLGLSSLTSAIIALGLYTSAYVAEILRSGLLSIPRGQREASSSYGLSNMETFRHVLLPQAARLVVGPLGTQFVLTIKNSSVASALAVSDILYRANNYAAITFDVYAAYAGVAGAYLLLTVPSSVLAQRLERHFTLAR
jgi:putative glutamine transport system permease protein